MAGQDRSAIATALPAGETTIAMLCAGVAKITDAARCERRRLRRARGLTLTSPHRARRRVGQGSSHSWFDAFNVHPRASIICSVTCMTIIGAALRSLASDRVQSAPCLPNPAPTFVVQSSDTLPSSTSPATGPASHRQRPAAGLRSTCGSFAVRKRASFPTVFRCSTWNCQIVTLKQQFLVTLISLPCWVWPSRVSRNWWRCRLRG